MEPAPLCARTVADPIAIPRAATIEKIGALHVRRACVNCLPRHFIVPSQSVSVSGDGLVIQGATPCSLVLYQLPRVVGCARKVSVRVLLRTFKAQNPPTLRSIRDGLDSFANWLLSAR